MNLPTKIQGKLPLPSNDDFDLAKLDLLVESFGSMIVSCKRCGWPVVSGKDCLYCGSKEPLWDR